MVIMSLTAYFLIYFCPLHIALCQPSSELTDRREVIAFFFLFPIAYYNKPLVFAYYTLPVLFA